MTDPLDPVRAMTQRMEESYARAVEPARRASEQIAAQRAAHEKVMGILDSANEARWRAEDERVDREKRSVELAESLLLANRALAESQDARTQLGGASESQPLPLTRARKSARCRMPASDSALPDLTHLHVGEPESR